MVPYIESTFTDPARTPPSGSRWTGRAGATPIPLPKLMEKIKKILSLIADEVRDAERKAEEAYSRSDSDFVLFMLYGVKFQRLHDEIAREHGLPRLEDEFRRWLKGEK